MKIQVIGASGTGKSTLCRTISEQTGVFWIDSDKYLWKDEAFTENHPVEERMRLCQEDMARHQDYIVSGSVYSWHPEGFQDRDMLVLLRLDEEARMKRLYDRELARFGERMLPGGDHYELTVEFLDWCRTYLSEDENAINSLACHMLRLREAKCKTLVLDAGQPVEMLAAMVLKAWADCQPDAAREKEREDGS